MARKESFLVFALSKINLVKWSLDQDKRRLKYVACLFFHFIQLGMETVLKVCNLTRTIFLAEQCLRGISGFCNSEFL